MSASQQRRAMFAGIAFVVLFVAGVILTFSNGPDIKSSDTSAIAAQKWIAELSDSGHRAGLLVGGYVLIVAALAFIWFCSGVREWLGASATGGRMISSLAVLGAGAITVASMTGGAAVAGGIIFGNEPKPQNGDAIRVVSEMFYPLLFVVFGLVSAGLNATIAASARRSARAPGWLAYAAGTGAVASIAAVFFFPMVLVLAWYLVLAIVGVMRAGTRAPAGAP